MRFPFKRQPEPVPAPKPHRQLGHTEWLVVAGVSALVLLANHPHPKVKAIAKLVRETLGDAASQL